MVPVWRNQHALLSAAYPLWWNLSVNGWNCNCRRYHIYACRLVAFLEQNKTIWNLQGCRIVTVNAVGMYANINTSHAIFALWFKLHRMDSGQPASKIGVRQYWTTYEIHTTPSSLAILSFIRWTIWLWEQMQDVYLPSCLTTNTNSIIIGVV